MVNLSYFGKYSVLRKGGTIGQNCDIRHWVYIDKNVTIGNNVKIFHHVSIASGTIIEDDVFIAPGVLILNTNKISHGRKYSPDLSPSVIKRGVRIGAGAIIMPGVIVGENAQIGAGAVVTKDVLPNVIVVGNPAKYLKDVSIEELI